LREKIDIPIIGIEPGIRPAILNTKTKNIGVLATEKTLESKLFNSTSKDNIKDGIKVHEQIGYGLVNEIEKGIRGNILIENYLKKYLSPMIKNNIDYLVLGCTHYNFLEEKINKILSKNIKIVDTISPVTNHVIKTLKSLKIENKNRSNNSIDIIYNGDKLSKEFMKTNYQISYLDF
ncbi:MAG: aspartate/glutamate racemase family protein, partial [Flavobacteriaceae bacterium]|nr:aspartate/glutamate racemase family protein [Flavobacteriaceae bacterium]